MPTSSPTPFILMTLAMLSFACMSSAIHGVEGMSIPQMVFIRNLMSLAIMTLWFIVLHRGFAPLKTNKMKQHVWRSVIGVVGMHLWFSSLTILPLNTAMALSFTVPIFSTVLAILLLGEKAGIRRWSAVIIGFLGVLVIVQPGAESMAHTGTLVGLAASLVIAITGIMIKSLTSTEHPDAIIYYMTVFMTLFSAPLAIVEWQPVSGAHLWMLLLISVFSLMAHMLMTRAFKMVDLITLMPLDYTRLIFTAILAYFFFDEVTTAPTIIGAVIIAASGLYIARREALKNKRIAAKAINESIQ